jgi:hypothetical protein
MAALVSAALQTKQTLVVIEKPLHASISLRYRVHRDCSPTGARRVLPSCLPNEPLEENTKCD